MTLLSDKEIVTVFERFRKNNPEPKSELEYKDEYTLLVAVVLSAQATDKSVNKATCELFKVADTPEKMVELGEKRLVEYIDALFPNPQSELDYNTDYQLLINVMLSAQTTDKRVNMVSSVLYKKYDTLDKLANANIDDIKKIIFSLGSYNKKASNVIEISKRLYNEKNGIVPNDREYLESLPGVGRKTANVVLNVVFNQPTMPVDTHLLRISPKIGLGEGTTPIEIEKSPTMRIPHKYMMHAHHWLILHGRYVCTARNPKCEECIISDLCKHNENND